MDSRTNNAKLEQDPDKDRGGKMRQIDSRLLTGGLKRNFHLDYKPYHKSEGSHAEVRFFLHEGPEPPSESSGASKNAALGSWRRGEFLRYSAFGADHRAGLIAPRLPVRHPPRAFHFWWALRYRSWHEATPRRHSRPGGLVGRPP